MNILGGKAMARKKIGLALGSGAARGFAHLGVLKVLEDEGIPIDYISGCSIGSIIGALYCSGMEIDEIMELAEEIEPWRWIDISVPRMGLILGKKIEDLVHKYTGGKRFEELDIPLSIVATNLCDGQRVVFNSGYVYRAVRASIAIPGIFTPVEENGKILADGGIVDPVPVDLVKWMGADIIVGVNLGIKIGEKKIQNIYDVIIQSIDIMQDEIIRLRGIEADLLINPDLKSINPVTFNQVKECFEIGRKAALEVMEDLHRALSTEGRLDWIRSLVRRKRTSR
jgi:NTE family protein